MKRNMPSACDIISDLPNNVIENILIHLPLRDAVKTSVLSKKWRHNWVTLPYLSFDDAFRNKPPRELILTIYQILLLHQGPIFKFTLSVPRLYPCPEINHLISFLSRNDIQDLTLCILSGCGHQELPLIFFACLQLKHLHLSDFLFNPPPRFEGFDKLLSIEFEEVAFTMNILKTFICKCPLLERLALKFCTDIGDLDIDAPKLKFLCFCGSLKFEYHMFQKNSTSCIGYGYGIIQIHRNRSFWLQAMYQTDRLPANLKYLKTLDLTGIRFEFLREVSCALCLIRSSPNLQKLRLTFHYTKSDTADDEEAVDKFLDSQDFSDIFLNKLREVETKINDCSKPGMEFVRLLLVKSPLLETMHIRHNGDYYNGYRILQKGKRFPRASSTAEIIYFNPMDSFVKTRKLPQ